MVAPITLLRRVSSTQLTRDEVEKKLGADNSVDAQLRKQCHSNNTHLDSQLASNCCGLTSVAYALTAIGCPTTVDEIFLKVGVHVVDSAVGMTLAEVCDASMRYVSRANLPVFVECYHFDKDKATPVGFKQACKKAEGHCGLDDIMILNFHSGMAHGWAESGDGAAAGGNHHQLFSVLTALSSDDEIIMADAHGVSSSFWSTPFLQMFEAMTDKDSSCGRARGALRFGRTDRRNVARPLAGMTPTLLDWCAPPPAGYDSSSQLVKYIPDCWDEERLGVKNMEGVLALSTAIRVMQGDDSNYRVDAIMRALNESFTTHLDEFSTAEQICRMANHLQTLDLISATARVETLRDFAPTTLKRALTSVQYGPNVVVMVCYDFNTASYGGGDLFKNETRRAGALSHGGRSWSLVASINNDDDHDEKKQEHHMDNDVGTVVIAPAHNFIAVGRLWTTSIARLAQAMEAVADGESGILVPPGNVAELGKVMVSLLNDETRRKSLGAGGRQHIAQHFSVAAMVSANLDVYKEVLGT